MSQEDIRAVNIMKSTIRLRSGHYEIALPWKRFPPWFPNNRPLAEHRLTPLKKRLLKGPKLFLKYAKFVDNLFEKQFAQKVSADSFNKFHEAIWYLPHHPVFSSNKPDKLWVKFNCAAVYYGASLNDQLLQGPDLTNKLFGVLTRFKQEPIAPTADIESMFYQVNVHPEDCNALSFLWCPQNDLGLETEEFQMTVHLFAATSSPSCSNFALLKTADDNTNEFENIVTDTVKRNFYVVDCLKSVKDEDKALTLACDLRKLLAKGGFRLTKVDFVSNSATVVVCRIWNEQNQLGIFALTRYLSKER